VHLHAERDPRDGEDDGEQSLKEPRDARPGAIIAAPLFTI
jgi:hypothetical protein